ncbi:MAG: transposase [Ktedonobacterales bacterium]
MTTHIHSREFKLQVVREELTGAKRPSQLCREYGISASVLCKWRRAYAQRGEAAFTAHGTPPEADQPLAERVADLERFCGQLAWENTVLKKALRRSPSHSVTA